MDDDWWGWAAAEGGAAVEPPPPLTEEQKLRAEKLAKIEEMRAKEVFVVEETGDYECGICGWTYKQADGAKGVTPGTAFADVPGRFS